MEYCSTTVTLDIGNAINHLEKLSHRKVVFDYNSIKTQKKNENKTETETLSFSSLIQQGYFADLAG